MIRVIGMAFAIAFVASLVSHGNKTVILIAFFGTLALIVLPLLSGERALRCPYCRKRVKLGAPTCHHCGRDVSRAVRHAAQQPPVPAAPAGDPAAVITALKELSRLRDSGALTEDEFVSQKARILGS